MKTSESTLLALIGVLIGATAGFGASQALTGDRGDSGPPESCLTALGAAEDALEVAARGFGHNSDMLEAMRDSDLPAFEEALAAMTADGPKLSEALDALDQSGPKCRGEGKE